MRTGIGSNVNKLPVVRCIADKYGTRSHFKQQSDSFARL